MILSQIFKIDPTAPAELSEEISHIWNEVVNSIVKEMLEYAEPHMGELHINLREEMTLELAKLISYISGKVVSARMGSRLILEIHPEVEREQCFSEAGRNMISTTAKNFAEHVWVKKYRERWKPKTETALKRDKAGRKNTKIVPQKVEENHFIPKSYIKKYWSEGQFIYKGNKSRDGVEQKIRIPVGSWGFRKNLYSDHLEAYFCLLEGDAARPIEMVLKVEPLNLPQREALIGFVIIQKIRNPYFMESLARLMFPLVADKIGEDKAKDKLYMQQVYETLYGENEFYDKLARPILFSPWVVVRSTTPDFVLPDVCNLFGTYHDRQYVFMPLTPTDCLIVLPIAVEEPRSLPYYITSTESMSQDISYVLHCAAKDEFLSASNATLYLSDEEPSNVIRRIILDLIRVIY